MKFLQWIKGWCEDIPWIIRVARGEDPAQHFMDRLDIPEDQRFNDWDGKFPGQ